jgi:hypothetical protein
MNIGKNFVDKEKVFITIWTQSLPFIYIKPSHEEYSWLNEIVQNSLGRLVYNIYECFT